MEDLLYYSQARQVLVCYSQPHGLMWRKRERVLGLPLGVSLFSQSTHPLAVDEGTGLQL